MQNCCYIIIIRQDPTGFSSLGENQRSYRIAGFSFNKCRIGKKYILHLLCDSALYGLSFMNSY